MELGQIPLALSLVRNITTYRLPVVYHSHLKGPVDEAPNFPPSLPPSLLLRFLPASLIPSACLPISELDRLR